MHKIQNLKKASKSLSVQTPAQLGFKGKFITIYGVNNIGKTTHAKMLVKRLQKEGFDAIYIKYPIYDLEPTGKCLNKILRGTPTGRRPAAGQYISEKELQTLFKQNRADFEQKLRQMLKTGKIVVAEDYTGTGIAWGMAKGLTRSFIEKLNAPLLKENFSILLTGHPDSSAKEANHLHEQNAPLLKRVNKIFIQLGEKYAWHRIKIAPKIEDTAGMVWKAVEGFLKGKGKYKSI